MLSITLINRAVVFALALCCGMSCQIASAQQFPSKQVELVAPVPPGGGTDFVARAVAETMRKYFPQPVVVVNKPGAAGSIGLGEVARSKPDGYKLGVIFPDIVWLAELGMGKARKEDFLPLAQFTSDPSSVTVRADAPWNTLEEFLAYAKANPERIRVANSGPGGSHHLAAAAIEDMASVKFTHVPYIGSAPAFLALLGGYVEATVVAPGEMRQHIEAGKLKVLAVMAEGRVKSFENIPTFKERGYDLVLTAFRGIAAPKGTPQEVVAKLREALKKVGEDAEFKSLIEKQGLTFSYADADALNARMDRDVRMMIPLLKRLKLGN